MELSPTARELKAAIDLRDRLAEIAAFFRDVDLPIQVMKVGEELGEVFEAFVNGAGGNPRKGALNAEEVSKELCDVIVTAFTALHRYVDDPVGEVEARARAIIRRHHEEVLS